MELLQQWQRGSGAHTERNDSSNLSHNVILWFVSPRYSSTVLLLLLLTSLNPSGTNQSRWAARSLRPLFSAPYLWLLAQGRAANRQRAWCEGNKGWWRQITTNPPWRNFILNTGKLSLPRTDLSNTIYEWCIISAFLIQCMPLQAIIKPIVNTQNHKWKLTTTFINYYNWWI